MLLREDYTLYIWLIVTKKHPRKKSGFRWGFIGKHYSCYSENVFKDECACRTSAHNFGARHGFGIKATYYTEREEFEMTR